MRGALAIGISLILVCHSSWISAQAAAGSRIAVDGRFNETAPAPDPEAGVSSSFLLSFISSAQKPATSDNTTAPLRLVVPSVSASAPAQTLNPRRGAPGPAPGSSPNPGPSPSPNPGPGPAPARSPSFGKRHLLQDSFNIQNNANIQWEAGITFVDASGKTQGPFFGVLDTGSSDFVVPGVGGPSPAFNPTDLTTVSAEVEMIYGGDVTQTVVGYFYPGSWHFVGATGKAATVVSNSNVLAADAVDDDGNVLQDQGSTVLGLGYKTSRVADAVPGARTPLLNFLSAAGLSYNAFTYYLHEIDPIPPLDSVVENQGQITFGNTLPDLVDSASGINAPALFQNVDLACHINSVTFNFGTNWVLPVSSFQTSPSSLGPSLQICNGGTSCKAIVDTGTYEVQFPPDVLPQVFEALGLPETIDLSKSMSFGRTTNYPEIDCSIRSRTTPSLDFLVYDRVYSLLPIDFVQQYNGKCYAIIGNIGQRDTYAFGAPFLAKFPGTFFTNVTSRPIAGSTCLYGNVPVVAQCSRPIKLNATEGCSAVISEAALLGRVNRANPNVVFTSNPPVPDRTQYAIQPRPDSNGNYRLPIGQNNLTLIATNSFGSSNCTVTVNVADQVPFTEENLSCGLPDNGVILNKFLNTDPTIITPMIQDRTGGCQVTPYVTDLSCQNCYLGPESASDISKCESKLVGNTVQVDSHQEGRLHWTVYASNGNSTVTKSCDVCVSSSIFNKCPTPYDASTPCVSGKY